MAYREQEKQEDKNRNAQRKLKVEIVERSCSEQDTSERYRDAWTWDVRRKEWR